MQIGYRFREGQERERWRMVSCSNAIGMRFRESYPIALLRGRSVGGGWRIVTAARAFLREAYAGGAIQGGKNGSPPRRGDAEEEINIRNLKAQRGQGEWGPGARPGTSCAGPILFGIEKKRDMWGTRTLRTGWPVSGEFFRCADYRTFTRMLPTDQG